MAENEKDDFWDISRLVPKRRSATTPFSTGEKLSALTIPGETAATPAADRTLHFETAGTPQGQGTAGRGVESYEPVGNRLLRRVTVRPSVDRFDFYDSFRKAALIYYEYRTDRCDFVSFYSYMPQYSQLSQEQKNYYFFWRGEVRRGKYPRTDYSYLYLYVYEILNLPDKIAPTEGLSLLCDVWCAYRKELPRIDHYFSAWVADYCLVHRLPCPSERIRHFLSDAIELSPLKEFYLGDLESAEEESIAAAMHYLSDYDWRCSRYAGGAGAAEYRSQMERAMRHLFGELSAQGLILDGCQSVTLVRDAFPHSLCTHSVKCRLEIEYYPLAASDSLRHAVTAAIKYIENKLRAMLGVKSRLSVKELPDFYRGVIDRYFAESLAAQRRERERAAQPEYERRYDAVQQPLSLADADRIESLSWQTTARLVAEEPDDAHESAVPEMTSVSTASVGATGTAGVGAAGQPSPQTACGMPDGAERTTETGETAGAVAFLQALLAGDDAAARSCCEAAGCAPLTLMEQINEWSLAYAGIGDVVLEVGESELPCVIEDYREDVEEWITVLRR